MISIQQLVHTIFVLIIVGLVFWLLYWALNKINPPEPFHRICEIIIILFGVMICIAVLLSTVSGTPILVW